MTEGDIQMHMTPEVAFKNHGLLDDGAHCLCDSILQISYGVPAVYHWFAEQILSGRILTGCNITKSLKFQ